jgi:hypothetical protein
MHQVYNKTQLTSPTNIYSRVFELVHGATVAAADYTISVTNFANPDSIGGKTPMTLDLWIFFSGKNIRLYDITES